MDTKKYQDIISRLKGVANINQFVIDSIKYFLIRSNDFDIISSCSESLFYQLETFITTSDHQSIQQILLATYGKQTLIKILNLLKTSIFNNYIDVRTHVEVEFSMLTSRPSKEGAEIMHKLEGLYNTILEIDYELNH